MGVKQTSDASSGFITTAAEANKYAVTDIDGTHPLLEGTQVREESGLVERPRILAELAYSLPSQSGISPQFGPARARTSDGTHTHEHDIGGQSREQ